MTRGCENPDPLQKESCGNARRPRWFARWLRAGSTSPLLGGRPAPWAAHPRLLSSRFYIESISYLKDNATIELFFLNAKSCIYKVRTPGPRDGCSPCRDPIRRSGLYVHAYCRELGPRTLRLPTSLAPSRRCRLREVRVLDLETEVTGSPDACGQRHRQRSSHCCHRTSCTSHRCRSVPQRHAVGTLLGAEFGQLCEHARRMQRRGGWRVCSSVVPGACTLTPSPSPPERSSSYRPGTRTP